MKMKGVLGKAVVVTVALVVILTLIVGGCAKPAPTPTPTPAPEVFHLRVQSWGGTDYLARLMIEDLMVRLEATGRFTFDYFPGEPLMSAAEAFDGMREGVLDMAISAAGYAVDRMGIVGVTEWMALNFDYDKFLAHYRDPGGLLDFYQPYYEKVGLRLLADLKPTPNILCSTRPVYTLEDLKGLIARNPGGGAEDYQKLLGMVPLSMPSAELYEGFQRGVVEGMQPTMSSYVSHKWYEVAPYVNMCAWLLGGMQLIMNNDVYNNLPADARALFDQAVLDAEAAIMPLGPKQEAEQIEFLKGQGVEIYYPPKEELARWEAVMGPYYDSLAEKFGIEWKMFATIRAKLK